MNTFEIINNDCVDVLRTMPDSSVDSIVTDPPYELGFMGKSWDASGIAYSVELWSECLRVLKAGGHLLSFGGSRTYHRMACAIEDAGFEVRDQIMWIYGSGFPKSLNISKAIDKAAGAEREIISEIVSRVGFDLEANGGGGFKRGTSQVTKAATQDAKDWDGWGTALKPAHEPIVVARKPLAEKTVAANVLAYGTGGLNIDGCRVPMGDEYDPNKVQRQQNSNGAIKDSFGAASLIGKEIPTYSSLGRFPANIIFDEQAAELLDQQSGERKGMSSQRNSAGTKIYGGNAFNKSSTTFPEFRQGYNDTGGASRFFYCAKASKRDRNEGLEQFEAKSIGAKGNGLARTCATCGATVLDGCECVDRTFENPTKKNFHPTVKPTELMRYLVRLVTPPNGTVLDPFTGSGSTGKAAILEGFNFIGAEQSAEYVEIANARILWAQEQMNSTLFN